MLEDVGWISDSFGLSADVLFRSEPHLPQNTDVSIFIHHTKKGFLLHICTRTSTSQELGK